MKHKRGESGFSLLLVLVLVVLLAVIGFSGWVVVSRHKSIQNGRTSSADNFIPGSVSVTFKDGVTFQQADSLVKSYGLSYWNPKAQEQNFIPTFYRAIKKDRFDQVAAALRKYPEVTSFIDDSSDPVNNRANGDEYWTKIVFKEDATWPQIKKIFIDSGVGLSNQPEQNFTDRKVWLFTPIGKESLYVNKFRQNPIVSAASRAGRPVPL